MLTEHGRGLDGQTVVRGRHRQSVELRLGRRRGRGLRGARYKQGWAEGLGRQASRRPKSSQNYAILARNVYLLCEL